MRGQAEGRAAGGVVPSSGFGADRRLGAPGAAQGHVPRRGQDRL